MGSLMWIPMWEPIEPPEPRPAWTSLDDMWIVADCENRPGRPNWTQRDSAPRVQ